MEPKTKKLTGSPSTSSISTDWNARISASTITVTMVGVSTGMVTWRSVPKTLLPATVDASSNDASRLRNAGVNSITLIAMVDVTRCIHAIPQKEKMLNGPWSTKGNRSISWLITP